MPSRGGRSGGGGSRPSRSSTPRSSSRSSSSSGSRGFRIGSSSRPQRSSTPIFNTPSNDTSNDSDQIYRQPNMYPRNYGAPGMGLNWRTIAILVGIILLGICACAAVGLFLQGMGYFS